MINLSTSVIIYVDQTPQATSTQGFPLNPGATLPWPAATPLYAACQSTATLQLVDAPVGYFDPSSLATAINLVGVPAVDQPTTIYASTQSVASNGTVAGSGLINVSRYQSVFMSFTEAGATSGLTTRDIMLSWYADAAGAILLAVETVQMATYLASAQIQRPVRGAYLAITAGTSTTVTSDSLTWTVVGSLRTVGWRTVLKSGKNNTSGQLQTGNDPNKGLMILDPGNIAANTGTVSEYPDIVCGPVTLNGRTETLTTSSQVIGVNISLWNGSTYYAFSVSGTVPQFSADIILPPAPVFIEILNFASISTDMLVATVSTLT